MPSRLARPIRSLAGASALVFVALTLSACSDIEASTPQPAQPQPVQVMTVSFEPLERQATYTGTLQPRYESDLGFRVGGKVTARHVDLGDTVRAGELLAELDATDLDLSAASSLSELEAARSSLKQAEAEVERFTALFQKRFVSQAALDGAMVARDEASARVERAARSLELAENQKAYADLRADHDGVVSSVSFEAGQVVTAGQPIVRLARRDAIDAVVSIPEHRLGELEGARATVALWGSDGAALPAKFRKIAPVADAASRTFEARFEIDARDATLAFGRTVTVALEQLDTPDIATLPLSAVLSEGNGPRVFRLSPAGDAVEKVDVEVLRFNETSALVSNGLAAGDRIVSLGLHRLDENLPVRVVEERAEQTSAF